MLKLVKPELQELAFRQKMLSDEQTMSYNARWGGAIGFPEERWENWYRRWISSEDPRYYYRYLYSGKLHAYVGEAAYHFEPETARYVCDVIIYHPYRGRGYGARGLALLCDAAREHGIEMLYDDIATDNPSIEMFLKAGFSEVGRTEFICTVRKCLK